MVKILPVLFQAAPQYMARLPCGGRTAEDYVIGIRHGSNSKAFSDLALYAISYHRTLVGLFRYCQTQSWVREGVGACQDGEIPILAALCFAKDPGIISGVQQTVSARKTRRAHS